MDYIHSFRLAQGFSECKSSDTKLEAPRRGHAIVEPAVVAHQAVGEGEQQAGGSASADEREGKVPAGSAAYTVVAEGRRQRMEGHDSAGRQELDDVAGAAQGFVDQRGRCLGATAGAMWKCWHQQLHVVGRRLVGHVSLDGA